MAATTKTTTQVNGNTVTQKRTIEVINPNQPEKCAIRKAKLRKQHTVGKLCLLFTIGCFALGTTVLPEASTFGVLFLFPGVMLTFSKKVWQGTIVSTIQELIDLLLDGWYSTKANSYEDFKLSDWLRGLFFGTENTR